MQLRKRFFIEFSVMLLLTTAILAVSGCSKNNLNSKTMSLNINELIGNEDISDISLTIYYMDPSILTRHPWGIDDLMESCEQKIVVDGNRLQEHIDLARKRSNIYLQIVDDDSYLDCRVYYMLESKKNGKLLDVAMWTNTGCILVNGEKVKGDDMFYNIITPFLTKIPE